jgi:hypothetical protein
VYSVDLGLGFVHELPHGSQQRNARRKQKIPFLCHCHRTSFKMQPKKPCGSRCKASRFSICPRVLSANLSRRLKMPRKTYRTFPSSSLMGSVPTALVARNPQWPGSSWGSYIFQDRLCLGGGIFCLVIEMFDRLCLGRSILHLDQNQDQDDAKNYSVKFLSCINVICRSNHGSVDEPCLPGKPGDVW